MHLASRALAVACLALPHFACVSIPIKERLPATAIVLKRDFFGREDYLSPMRSTIAGTPFGELNDVINTIADGRKTEAVGQVFVMVRRHQGFDLTVYRAARRHWVALEEILLAGLPLADPQHPQTLLIDSFGHIGRILLSPDGSFRLEPFPREEELAERRRDLRLLALANLRDSRDLELWLSPLIDLPAVIPDQLVNSGHNVTWHPQYAFLPGPDPQQVRNILLWAQDNAPAAVIKAGGARHSWSPVAATDGLYLYPDAMTFLEPATADGTIRESLQRSVQASLFRVGAGTTIRSANEKLWQGFRQAFPVLGGFDGQTMGGVFPTGTHGSVLRHGPLAEMVRSIDLVTGGGDVVRVEPADGPTDPTKFARAYPRRRLIQDDEYFDAVLIHVGTIGVVMSYVIATVHAFSMEEIRTATTLDKMTDLLHGGNIYNMVDVPVVPPWVGHDTGARFPGHPWKAYHLELLINVHSELVIVTSRQPRVDIDDAPRAASRADLLRRPGAATWLEEHFPWQIAAVTQFIATTFPRLVPWVNDRAMATLPARGYVNRSYRVFNIGDGANRIPALSATLFVPLRDDKYLRALAILRATARRFVEEQGKYETGPVSMRFVHGSRAHLAPPEDVCAFEFIFAGTTPWASGMVKAYYQALKSEFGTDVWIHWGQLVTGANSSDILGMYKRYQKWRVLRDQFDPRERFLNEWQRTMLPR